MRALPYKRAVWHLLKWHTLDCLDSSGLGGEHRRTAAFEEDRGAVAAEPVCPKLAQLLPGRHAERFWTDCRRLPCGPAVDS